jgi:hypothetical protein
MQLLHYSVVALVPLMACAVITAVCLTCTNAGLANRCQPRHSASSGPQTFEVRRSGTDRPTVEPRSVVAMIPRYKIVE